MTFIDGHCDTLTMAMRAGKELWDFDGHLNFEKLRRFRGPVQVFAIWLDDDEIKQPYDNTIQAVDFAKEQFKKHEDIIKLANSYDDVLANMDAGICTALLGIEGAEPIGSDISKLHHFYSEGVRVLTLTWNRKNAVSESIACEAGHGLTSFGREVVAECNRLGILVDVSHLSVKGFWDLVEYSETPFTASHSNCLKLCSHRRNLDDEQIREIARRGGVIGLNLATAFLHDTPEKANIDTVLRHLEHMANVGGVGCAALGGDLDGIPATPEGINDLLDYEKLYKRIEAEFGVQDANKIFFGNFLRVFGETL